MKMKINLNVLSCLLVISAFGSCFCCCPGTDDPLPPGGFGWKNCTRPNEFYSCGSACQNECKTLGERCPIVNIRCNDACYCCDGFARDEDGNCIPEADCPPKGSC